MFLNEDKRTLFSTLRSGHLYTPFTTVARPKAIYATLYCITIPPIATPAFRAFTLVHGKTDVSKTTIGERDKGLIARPISSTSPKE